MLEADAFATLDEREAGDIDGLGTGVSVRRPRKTGSKMSVEELARLTVPQLKLELRARQLVTTGTKYSLLRRLLEALEGEQDAIQEAEAAAEMDAE